MPYSFRRRLGFLAALLLAVGPAALPARAAAQVTPPADQPPAQAGVQVDSILVRGNQRVATDVILVTSALEPGTVTGGDVQDAIRRLMATGHFERVDVLSQGDPATGVSLVIDVAERPFISAYAFRGLERISARTVRDTVDLEDNRALDPALILRTERMIRDLLAKEGVQLIGVDTTLTPANDSIGSFTLTFNVREGNRLSIAAIEFVGNESFGDEALRDAMKTSEEGFLWFQAGRYDGAVLEEDLRQRLPAFYGEHGYVDFTVVSDTLVVDPVSGKARLTIEVTEGAQYRLGEFSVAGNSRFPTEQLEQMFRAQRRSVLGLPFGSAGEREAGEIFDRTALDDATERVQQMYRNEGYLYAQVVPRIDRLPTDSTGGVPIVNVTWAISENNPFYIGRVTIEGNTYTHDYVIRDRLLVFPGDVYNEERVLQSYQGISALGFFETPLPTPDILPDPENATVDLVFHVKEKQTGSLNFGTAIGGGDYYGSVGGVTGFLGYSQPNLFGQAKQADIQVEYGYGRSSLVASYTDPAIFQSRNSASVSVFHTDDRYRGFSFTDGRYVRTGASFRLGFPVPGLTWTRAFTGYSLSRYSYEARDTDDCVGNIFCQPSSVASNVSLALTRDTRNHPLFPTSGTQQNLTVEQTGGPLGGDGNFQKLMTAAEWWVPVGRLGGSTPGSRPIIFAFGLRARGGAVFGDAERFPLNRFFVGGTQYGEALRGYGESTITPVGYCDIEAELCSLTSSERLGDAFAIITAEYAARFTDNISVSLFTDAGNTWAAPGEINPTRLFRSVGLGATIITPFGPLGLDYAYAFDRPGTPWKFHFKINQGRF